MRRKYYLRKRCAHPGCCESANYEYDTQHEYLKSSMHKREWRCTRHSDPDALLSAENTERAEVLTATESGNHLYWHDGERLGSGLALGPGFKAFAKDFPKGTRLIVTARIELPHP